MQEDTVFRWAGAPRTAPGVTTDMTRMNDDFDDFDADDLSPDLAAQLERLERNQHFRAQEQTRLRKQKLRVRRRLEDWGEDRRLRDEFDYLS